jgi:hypothetical protein
VTRCIEILYITPKFTTRTNDSHKHLTGESRILGFSIAELAGTPDMHLATARTQQI